ncbi:hypothetical protein DXG03_004454 [Asterophora parasitica]|uniref:F-box domain-containing protein n=1 Tax=Asterophora parasitica TaxID=117018 RepID=A0A9P7G408_9AGAR|nr:hypothetical protein DXG03_004454 [Asterophora parasitica]
MLIHKEHLEIREKVLSDAGIRNELVLSPHELECTKVLLCDYEATLLELDRQLAPLLTRRARIEEHLHTFRVAVAPHKRIPVELLNKIFAECEPDPLHVDDQPIPLNTRRPWVLGQVCSLWRRVSRNDAGLWRDIILKTDTSSERLCHILPTVASKTLEITDHPPFSVNSAGNIIPQVRMLDILMCTKNFKRLFDRLPADIFGNLETLDIYLTESTLSQTTPLVLTKSLLSMRNLHSLTLGCDEIIVPQALSLNFPWHQIVSLDISDVESVHLVAFSKYLREFKSLKSLVISLTDHEEEMTIADTQLVVDTFGSLPHSLHSLTIQANDDYSCSDSM